MNGCDYDSCIVTLLARSLPDVVDISSVYIAYAYYTVCCITSHYVSFVTVTVTHVLVPTQPRTCTVFIAVQVVTFFDIPLTLLLPNNPLLLCQVAAVVVPLHIQELLRRFREQLCCRNNRIVSQLELHKSATYALNMASHP